MSAAGHDSFAVVGVCFSLRSDERMVPHLYS